MPTSSFRLQRRDVLVAGAAGLLLPQWARAADEYPSRPITFICPWPAGGTADSSMRAICEVAGRILEMNQGKAPQAVLKR